MKAEPVALYARTSSDEQRDQQTIKTQLEYARGRARLEGWTLREFVDDGVSGKKIPLAKRPAGAELLAAARRGEITRLVTYRLDRLGRRARYIHEALEDLTEAGVAYQSLTEPFDTATPAGKLFLGLLASMAEFEADSIAQRTGDGRKRVASYEGRWLAGPVPYGYSSGEDHRLVVELAEAKVVREIFAAAIAGNGSRRIAAELNERGIPYASDRAGKRCNLARATWDGAVITRILRSETYAGRAAYFRRSRLTEAIYRDVPAIITPATFLAARRAVAQQQRFGGAHASRDYALRGLVTCGGCERAMIGRRNYSYVPKTKPATADPKYAYYCSSCPTGQRPTLLERPMVDVLWNDVLDLLAHPDATLRALARSATEVGSAEERTERELIALTAKMRELDDQEEQLIEMRLAKTITAAILEKKAKAVQAQRAQIRLQIEAVRQERAAAVRAAAETVSVRKLLAGLRQQAERAGEDLAVRTEIIRAVTKRITVSRSGGRTRAYVTYAFGPAAAVADSRSGDANRLSFTAWTKSSGTARRHFSNVFFSGCRSKGLLSSTLSK